VYPKRYLAKWTAMLLLATVCNNNHVDERVIGSTGRRWMAIELVLLPVLVRHLLTKFKALKQLIRCDKPEVS
jgi:hypothetical protein